MNWAKLLNEGRVARERTSKQEIDNLRSLVARCFADMAVSGLSDEQRFIIAYDAARTLAVIVVRASGFRPKKLGGHVNTFLALAAADPAFSQAAAYFDVCRAKRNDAEYDFAGGVSQSDADDLANEVQKFRRIVEQWIAAHYPALV
jgi:hypothetical protein